MNFIKNALTGQSEDNFIRLAKEKLLNPRVWKLNKGFFGEIGYGQNYFVHTLRKPLL